MLLAKDFAFNIFGLEFTIIYFLFFITYFWLYTFDYKLLIMYFWL